MISCFSWVKRVYFCKINKCTIKTISITDHRVVSSHSVIMDPAYVHVTKEMENDRDNQKRALSALGVYSIGRYGSWTYCSIEDNIKEANSLALQLNKHYE